MYQLASGHGNVFDRTDDRTIDNFRDDFVDFSMGQPDEVVTIT